MNKNKITLLVFLLFNHILNATIFTELFYSFAPLSLTTLTSTILSKITIPDEFKKPICIFSAVTISGLSVFIFTKKYYTAQLNELIHKKQIVEINLEHLQQEKIAQEKILIKKTEELGLKETQLSLMRAINYKQEQDIALLRFQKNMSDIEYKTTLELLNRNITNHKDIIEKLKQEIKTITSELQETKSKLSKTKTSIELKEPLSSATKKLSTLGVHKTTIKEIPKDTYEKMQALTRLIQSQNQ